MVEEAEERYVAASAALQRAIEVHTSAVLAAGGDAEAVEEAFVGFSEAQSEYFQAEYHLTGQDEEEDTEPLEGDVISVLQRHDYEVVDADALMAAGRAAYLTAWPDDDEAAAAVDVTHLGRALYQVAHVGGWDRLREVDGIVPVAGVVAVVRQEEPLGEDPDTWTDELGVDEDDLLHGQSDVWRPTPG